MNSKRERAGYLMIDHRESPGVSDELNRQHGLPAGAGRGLFEISTYNCGHCSFTMLSQREQALPYCRKCDKYICERCEKQRHATGECRPVAKMLEEGFEAAQKSGLIIT